MCANSKPGLSEPVSPTRSDGGTKSTASRRDPIPPAPCHRHVACVTGYIIVLPPTPLPVQLAPP